MNKKSFIKKIFQKKVFYLFLIINCFAGNAWSQTLFDSYADGDFTASPAWGGNTSLWTIVTSSDAAAGATNSNTLRLNGSAVSATDYLSSQVSSWGAAQEWDFWLGRRAQAFTAANQQYFWLYANEATLNNATVDGYRIAIGDDTGGDEVRLEYILNGAVSATVITSSGAVTNGLTDIGFLVRVTRSSTGVWALYTSTLPTANGGGAIATDIPSSATATVSQGSATNNTLTPAANGYLGVAALHSTGANAINTAEYDQIYFSAISTPTTTSISPSSATAGGSGFTITVNGTNFVTGLSTVTWNGSNRTTTFVSATQLTASITAGDISASGTATVGVTTTGAAASSNTQTFTINTAASPEINLKQGSTSIATGGSYDFGSILNNNSSAAITFTIENLGSANLNLTGTPKIALSGTNADQFSVNQSSTTTPISGPTGTTTFTITFSPTSSGNKTATITIANNDADEGTYTVTITGTGVAPSPEINLKQGATDIASGGTYGFGSVTNGTSSSAVTFTIENTGTANLTLTGTPKIGLSGTNAAEFSVDQSATTTPVAGPSGTTTFTVTFSPATSGSKTATITIVNNDADEGTYTFSITGTGVAPDYLSLSTAGTAVTEDFTSLSTSQTATLPSGFKVSNVANGVTYSIGLNGTTQAAGTSGSGILTGTSAGGIYNFGNGVTASASDRALGFLTSSGFASTRSILLRLRNNTGSTITQLAVAFDYEKYRSGSTGTGLTFFHGATDGSINTSATGGDQSYAADANNTVISNPPTTTSKSFSLTSLNISNGADYYFRWTYTVSGNSNAQAIGIDNLSIIPCGTVVTPSVSIAITSGANPTCSGSSVTFTATPTNGGSPSYQWKKDGTNVGTNSATYTDAGTAAGSITCVMTSTLTCVTSSTATSNAISLTITSPVTPSVSIAITSGANPTCSGTSVTFTATPTNGGTPSYQWKKGAANVGTNSATYTDAGTTAGSITCVMTSTLTCVTSSTATSNAISLAITSPVTPSVSIAITSGTNPTCSGTSVTFTATPTNGGTPSYQWKKDAANVGTYSATYIDGGTTAGSITCIMTSTLTCVTSSTATSNAISLAITSPVTPSVSIAVTSGTNPTCSGSSVTFTATPTNGGTPSYQWKKGATNVGTNNATYTDAGTTGGSITVVMTSGLSCVTSSTATSNAISLVVSSGYNWTGGGNPSNYNDPANWTACGIPPSGSNVTIASGTGPTITGTTSVGNLTINSGVSVTVNGSGVLKIAGAITNNGTFTATGGEIELNGGSAQSIAGSVFAGSTIKALKVSNAAGVTLTNTLNITDSVTFGPVGTPVTGSTLASGGNLVIKSSETVTGRIGQLLGGNNITGSVVIERHIRQNPKRAWRMLSAPTNGQTINAAWQEGATGYNNDPNPGHGTLITTKNPLVTGDGFDAQTVGNSILTFSGTSWVGGVTSTTGKQLNSEQGYMLFIRGDRNVDTSFNDPSSGGQTILRSTGTINQGNLGAVTVPGNLTNTLVGNKYASAIDFTRVLSASTGIKNLFTVWDPKGEGGTGVSAGLGRYVTIIGPDYLPTPSTDDDGTLSYPNVETKSIESGQAFFVQPSGSGGGQVNLTEACKISSNKNVFRPAGNDVSVQFKTNLFSVNATGRVLADGNRVRYNEAYSDAIDDNDAIKMSNFGVNFGIQRDDKTLIIESRKPITSEDLITFNMWNLSKGNYELEFTASGLAGTGITAFLEDNYLTTSRPLNLDTKNTVPFTVDEQGSFAPNRFRVVFKPGAVVPLRFTSLKAYQKDSDIEVNWKVGGENGILQYEVEHSTNGRDFAKAATIAASNAVIYSWLDVSASAGVHFYRIRSVDATGQGRYTSIAKVVIGAGKKDITIYPNPVKDGLVTLQFNNKAAGTYHVRLLNVSGQVLYKSTIVNSGNNESQTFTLPASITHGIYKLEILQKGNRPEMQELIIN